MDSLLYVDVQHQHDLALLPLLNSINRELRDWVVGRSKVQTVLTQRPTASCRIDVITSVRNCVFTS
jgi:hypothetical protein